VHGKYTREEGGGGEDGGSGARSQGEGSDRGIGGEGDRDADIGRGIGGGKQGEGNGDEGGNEGQGRVGDVENKREARNARLTRLAKIFIACKYYIKPRRRKNNRQDGGGERWGLVWSSHKPAMEASERERERDLEVKGFKDKNVIQLKK
jgi:hypothetical protein